MTTTSYDEAREAEAVAVDALRAEFVASLRIAPLPDPVRVYLFTLAEAATATNGYGYLVKAPVPGSVEVATGFGSDLFSRVHDIALATGWLRSDEAVRGQVLLVDVPRWVARTMDLGLYDDPTDPQWHGRPVEPFEDTEVYKARVGALALA
ncbi:hypothetical protein [Streptacidiphilus sp. EB103A]|uniref:hypothetical protein n=1 Tax=Streptacidiphilus sp. EB103A TaxID=3156275 RepID=UPI00351369B2